MSTGQREPIPSYAPRGVGQRTAIRTQHRKWQRAAGTWDRHGAAGLRSVIDAVLSETPQGNGVVVDVGAGTGALAVPLAARAQRVVAVDVSSAMLAELRLRSRRAGITNIESRVAPIEAFEMPPGSVDLVVSNYALHHLLDHDKQRFVERAAVWLRPGGKLVIGDMMLGRGGTAADRAIIASKVRVMLGRGPGGWWRLIKNVWRFSLRVSERPIPLHAWVTMLRSAGLVDVSARRIVAEAGVVCGRRPAIMATARPGRSHAQIEAVRW